MEVAGRAGGEPGERPRRQAGRERREIDGRHAGKMAAPARPCAIPAGGTSYPLVPIREVVVHSLGDLIAQTTPTEPDPATGRRRSSGVYRGAADAAWPLLTSLDQLGGAGTPHTKAELEEYILRNFIRYSRPYFGSPPVNDWEVLVAAQHHGLPDPAAGLDLLAAGGGALRHRRAAASRPIGRCGGSTGRPSTAASSCPSWRC